MKQDKLVNYILLFTLKEIISLWVQLYLPSLSLFFTTTSTTLFDTKSKITWSKNNLIFFYGETLLHYIGFENKN